MFGKRLRLFKLFGFQVHVDLSWLVIAALVTWTLAVGIFPQHYPGFAAENLLDHGRGRRARVIFLHHFP